MLSNNKQKKERINHVISEVLKLYKLNVKFRYSPEFLVGGLYAINCYVGDRWFHTIVTDAGRSLCCAPAPR